MYIRFHKGHCNFSGCPVWWVFDNIPVDGPYAENPLCLADCDGVVFYLPAGGLQK